MGWLFLHTQRGSRKRYAPDLLADPVVSFVDRTFLVWAVGGLGAAFGLGWLIGGTLHRRAHRPAVGRRRAAARPAPRDLLDQLAVPLLRAPALRHRRRVAQPRVALAAVLRRGVAQQPPRLPDLRGPRDALVRVRHLEPRSSAGSRSVGLAWDVVRIDPARQQKKLLAETARSRWPSRRPLPCAARWREALPERPFTVAFWDGTEVPATAPGPRFTVRSPRAVAHALYAPGQLGLGRAYVSGELEVDDIDATIDLLQTWKPPSLDRAAKAPPGAGRRPRDGPRAPAGAPAVRARARGAPALDRARPALGAPPLRPAGGVLRALPRRVDDLQLRDLLARGRRRSRRPRRPSSSSCAPSSASRPASACSTSAAAGAASPSTRPSTTASTSPASRCRRRRPSAPARAPRRPASPTASTSASRTGASWLGERFDAIASIGMVEHVGNVQIDAYAQRLRDLLEPEGRLLNHGIARVRHGDPEAGPFSERYVFPDAAPLHVGRVIGAFERRRPAGRPHRGLPVRLRRDAAPLGDAPRREPRPGDRARRPRARAHLAAVPARRALGLHDRLHLDLPGPRGAARRRARRPWAPRARRSASRRRGRPAAARSRRGRGSGPPGPLRDRRR